VSAMGPPEDHGGRVGFPDLFLPQTAGWAPARAAEPNEMNTQDEL
jgi:hypothetical protein